VVAVTTVGVRVHEAVTDFPEWVLVKVLVLVDRVPVTVGVLLRLAVPVCEGIPVGVKVPEADPDPVGLRVPSVKVDMENVSDGVRESADGVGVGGTVLLASVPVGVVVNVTLGVPVTEGVAEKLFVGVRLLVPDQVTEGVEVHKGLSLTVWVREGAVGVQVRARVEVDVGDGERVGVRLLVGVGDSTAVGGV